MKPDEPSELTIRCGFEIAYEAADPVPALLVLRPQSGPGQQISGAQFAFEPECKAREYRDWHGNLVQRTILPRGKTRIRYDATVEVPAAPENADAPDGISPIEQMPADVLRYTLPSRYCDSDRLMEFAEREFGGLPPGRRQVQAICDWVHRHVEYRWGAGSSEFTASDIMSQRFGVCRDFAHLAIALCRCLNIPARYATGFVPDVAYPDPGTPMDFHAYFQAYLGGRWQTFDARFNVPRIGRIHIACGLDAVDAAFSTLYGAVQLTWFQVWAYQIDPAEVRIGDPVDLSKRLDGTPDLRFPAVETAETHQFAA